MFFPRSLIKCGSNAVEISQTSQFLSLLISEKAELKLGVFLVETWKIFLLFGNYHKSVLSVSYIHTNRSAKRLKFKVRSTKRFKC